MRYSSRDKITYYNKFSPFYDGIDVQATSYAKKYEYFFYRFMSFPQGMYKPDYEWYDFVSEFLIDKNVQNILKRNDQPIWQIVKFMHNRFMWTYSTQYNKAMRKIKNPYFYCCAKELSSLNLGDTTYKNIRLKEIFEIISKLAIAPRKLRHIQNEKDLFGDNLLIDLKTNYTTDTIKLNFTHDCIPDKYKKTLEDILILNSPPQSKNEYMITIVYLLKKLSVDNIKSYERLLKFNKKVKFRKGYKNYKKGAKYFTENGRKNNYMFKYDINSKEWVHHEQSNIK